ncbi:hypothetical protein B0H63DRAFT_489974 [Podospora didyma]|uniref:Hemerythrin-like domain-containing protein n=1 Tax=Podospora didyma TaxID=330526 RepID=A0AAE0N3C5_9PEZI|nr:hypothetical protein B0H63DRAFT_489974 [Podospora didyma]
MAPVYADHPFSLIPTPVFLAKSKDPNAKTDKFDEIASEMANVHNIMLRGLNSIYLQAPHISQGDIIPFCRYISGFCSFIHIHHNGEEEQFFPEVEKMAGVKGLMDGNVEQHRVFQAGLKGLEEYTAAVLAGKEEYSGEKIKNLVDGFGAVLVQHLTDEIPTLLGLREYEDKMAGLEKAIQEEAETSMKTLGNFGMVWCFANLDIHFENDIWLGFPPAPAPVKFLFRNLFWWFYPDARKFGSVDRQGKLKPLYAVPVEGEKAS